LSREYFVRTGTTDTGQGLQTVAENVEALEFCYILEDGTETIAPTAAEFDSIRSIIVSALLRVRNPIKEYRDGKTYVPAAADGAITPDLRETRPSSWGPFGDSYVRRLAIFKVKCRNLSMSPI
jgi:type IV pilus assembly protein PilW